MTSLTNPYLKKTDTLQDLLSTQFNAASLINNIIVPRQIQGDYDGLAIIIGQKYRLMSEMHIILRQNNLEDIANDCDLTQAQHQALDQLNYDIKDLKENDPTLYLEHPLFSKRAQTWHIDSTPESFFCETSDFNKIIITYNLAATMYLANTDAEIITDDDIFYREKENAQTWQAGLGDISMHRNKNNHTENNWSIHKRPEFKHDAPARLIIQASRSREREPTSL